MIIGIISCFIIVAVLIIVMVRGFNYNHRIGEGMFKNSEYNLDERRLPQYFRNENKGR